jgi:hypothetical protein
VLHPRGLAVLALSLVVGGLYAAACVLPAVEYLPPTHRDFGDITPYGSVPGIVALIFGIGSEARVAWSANVFFLAGWILLLCRRDTLAACCGLAAVVLGLTTWLFVDDQMKLLVGYYFWQGSLGAFVAGALAVKLCFRARKQQGRIPVA